MTEIVLSMPVFLSVTQGTILILLKSLLDLLMERAMLSTRKAIQCFHLAAGIVQPSPHNAISPYETTVSFQQNTPKIHPSDVTTTPRVLMLLWVLHSALSPEASLQSMGE